SAPCGRAPCRTSWPPTGAPPPISPRAVLGVLELWLQEHPDDFREPPWHPSLQRVLGYLGQAAPGSQAWGRAEGLLRAFLEVEEEQHTQQGGLGARTPRREHAVRTTPPLCPQELFVAVRPFHCLGCVWSQRDKKENKQAAPSVRATVAQFNAVTSCSIASVLGNLTLRAPQRARLLETWVAIAQRCRSLRNFSSLRAVLSALQSNPIYRLKRTWAAVNR
uniref:Ras-GEF domain-containing protein n=1 Tax=Sphenodon punctatus TaxID=8508 RepID=A0A8D0HGK9_SPHPU